MVAWAREGFIQSACSSQRHTLRDNKKQNMRVVTGVVIFHLKWSHIRSIKFFHHVFHHIKKIRHPPHLWTAIRPFLQSNSQWSARSWADKNGKVTEKTGNNYGNDWNLWKNYGKTMEISWFSPSQLNFFIAEIRTARITPQFGAWKMGMSSSIVRKRLGTDVIHLYSFYPSIHLSMYLFYLTIHLSIYCI